MNRRVVIAAVLLASACGGTSEPAGQAASSSVVETTLSSPTTTASIPVPTTLDIEAFEAGGEGRSIEELAGLDEATVVDWAERSGFQVFLGPDDVAPDIFMPRRIRISVDEYGIVTRVRVG